MFSSSKLFEGITTDNSGSSSLTFKYIFANLKLSVEIASNLLLDKFKQTPVRIALDSDKDVANVVFLIICFNVPMSNLINVFDSANEINGKLSFLMHLK